MKLRLRSDETKETLRIEVPNPCSLQHLKQLLSHTFSSSSSLPSSIHLSLNRKDELHSSSPEESIQSLGITSGDLIFFTLNPNGFSSQTLTVQSHTPQGPNSDQPQNSQETRTLAPSSQKEQTLDSENMITETRGVDYQNDETLEMNTQNEENLDLDNTEDMVADDDDGSVLDVGKSFSVPGFLRKVFTEELGDDGGRHHKLLVIAVHAVLLESGFVGFDPFSNMEVNGFQVSDEWPSFAFMMSLWYTLPEVIAHGRDHANGTPTILLKFQSLGKFFNVYGTLSNGSGTHMVCLDEDRLVPFLNVVWANCGLADEVNGKNEFCIMHPETEVFKFWKDVKDRLALPLLIDLCEKAGLPPPPCFMRLPTDLKLKILESLPGVDIAKTGCVCSELRYLASNDDLWKQKFVEQYGDAERSEGGSHWKEKFAKSWEGRKRRKIASNFLLRMRRDHNPFLVPPIIGGDYDLLPHLRIPVRLGQPDHAYRGLRNTVPHCNLGGFNA